MLDIFKNIYEAKEFIPSFLFVMMNISSTYFDD